MRSTCLLLILFANSLFAAPQEIFKGVSLEIETRSTPRPLRLYWIEASLGTSGVSLEFSPLPDSTKASIQAVRPTELLEKLKWQVIMNGDAFQLLGKSDKKYPDVGDPLDLQGAAIWHGRIFSDPIRNYGVFYTSREGRMGISYPPLPKGVWNAIGGYRVVLNQSRVLKNSRTALHPRSVIGFNNDSNKVYFLVVDGRQPGKSEGATEQELGEWMKARGAEGALSLDGGGSSLLAIDNGGKAKVVNTPVGLYDELNTERPVGNCLGLKANSKNAD
jgi:hypothetical protein